MQIYAIDPSFIVGQLFKVGVEPNMTFGIGIYRHDVSYYHMWPIDASEVMGYSMNVEYLGSTSAYPYFRTGDGPPGPPEFDKDWDWPTIALKLNDSESGKSDVYIAVAFPTTDDGVPTDDLGRAVADRSLLSPLGQFAASMALLVGRPLRPRGADIAYVVPIATYHAYNGNGGGCFYGYDYPPIKSADEVTMRRPGGGFGALMGEPRDEYDQDSPRQQFTHWDARFMSVVKAMQADYMLGGVDYYTDLDFHLGAPEFDLSAYKVVVSAGHHEYWSQSMRSNLEAFLKAGGNYACFSGNTCYRPIDFGNPGQPGFGTVVHKVADQWPNFNESALIGLSWGYGGGQWGKFCKSERRWVDTERPQYGFVVQPGMSRHWCFFGTELTDGKCIGKESWLVGYETDGVNPSDPSPVVLAQSPCLSGFQVGADHQGAIVIKNDAGIARPSRGVVFNAGTTDWPRVLMGGTEAAKQVWQITLNVLRKFTDRPLLPPGRSA